MVDVKDKLGKSLSTVQEVANKCVRDRLVAFQKQVNTLLKEIFTASEQKFLHVSAELVRSNEHSMLYEDPGSLETNSASPVSALQDKLPVRS